jgi:hypothetical protein
MSSQMVLSLQRWVNWATILSFLAVATIATAWAGAGSDDVKHATNQDVRVEGDVVFISYELEVPADETYIVELVLLKESDPSFNVHPTNVSGEVGEVTKTGPKRLIRWEYKKDFPTGFRGEDYYFRIDVSPSGHFPWLWTGLGTLAVGTAAFVLLTHTHTSSTPPSESTSVGIPYPPSRSGRSSPGDIP